jgi:acyl-CoA thioesterase
MAQFDDALALRLTAEGLWLGFADTRYEAMTGMYGGWTAAVLLRAVMLQTDSAFTPSALTINYIQKIEPGRDVFIRVRCIGGSRSIQHWQAEILHAVAEPILAHAMLVLAARRETDGHTEPSMPDVPDPETLEDFYLPFTRNNIALKRLVHGYPPFARSDTASVEWVREFTGRRLDLVQLTFLSDLYLPRPFFWSAASRPYATLSLSVYFHATPAEIEAVGADFILNEAIGTRGEHSTSGQQARLWSRDGKLLATTEQLGWFR